MKKMKVISFLLALIMLLTVFAGCGSKETTEKETESPAIESRNEEKTEPSDAEETEFASEETEATEPISTTTPQATEATEPTAGTLPTGLTATKVGTVEGKSIYRTSSTGIIYYDETEALGIMTPDCKSDTGAKYTSCSDKGSYFVVTSVDRDSIDPNAPATLNCFGLVDATGKEILPQKYASIEAINDRFIYAAEVTEATDSEDDALLYYSSSFFSITPDKDDPLFKGIWYVYDVLMGRFVNGVTGTNYPSILDNGDFIRYKDDNGDRITVDPEGKPLPDDADTLDNDCYKLEDAVYNSKHEKIFDIDPNGYSPSFMEFGYYVAANYDTGTYVLMDYNGNVVSAEFSDFISVYGNLIVCDDKIYNFKGEQVIDGSYDRVYLDEMYGATWVLEYDDVYTMIDQNGNVLWQSTEEEDVHVSSSTFCIEKQFDDGRMLYSFGQKDYTIDGYGIAPWLAGISGEDYTNDLVDTLSGETILTGYWSYEYIATPGSTYYVYAGTLGDGFDIFTIS